MHVIPQKYAISWKLDSDTFEGTELITIDVAKEVESVSFNSVGLQLANVAIDGTAVEPVFDLDNETVTLHKRLATGVHLISLEFNGRIGLTCAGIFTGTADGSRFYATHFEPLSAHLAFPCFDDPKFRAIFELQVTTDRHTVVSNTAVATTSSNCGDWKTITFHPTAKIPPYLVAFTAGQFEYRQFDAAGTPTRLYSTPALQSKCDFAGDVAVKALNFFSKVLDVPYPAEKLDICGIPKFEKAGMENFAAIFLKEAKMAVDDDSSQYFKEEVAETVIHEIAHQWFGDLVTIDSWDQLWLKEGFATWMSWLAIDELFPEWKTWETYAVYSLQNALAFDALKTTHPVILPKKITNVFTQDYDLITYQKGCVLVTMLSEWLSPKVFLSGISEYLKRFAWKLATSEDLWRVLGDVSGKDVMKYMQKWTTLPGYPVVFVDEKEGELVFTQQRFLSSGEKLEGDEIYNYPVSLNIKYADGVDRLKLLESTAVSFPVPGDDFFKVNADLVGFFRTSYSLERWKKLGAAGAEGKLSVTDRIGLIADSCLLAAAGIIPIVSFFELIERWVDECNINVWDEILNDIYSVFDTFIFDDFIQKGLQEFLRGFIAKHILDSVIIDENDSFETSLFKSRIFSAAYSADSPIVTAYSKQKFKEFLASESEIDPDRRAVVFKNVCKYGDEETFNEFKSVYSKSNIGIQEDVLTAIGRFTDRELIKKVLEFVQKEVPAEDVILTLNTLKIHRTGIEEAWHWVREEWNNISETAGPLSDSHFEVVKGCLAGLCTHEQELEVCAFFSDKPAFERIAKDAIEKIRTKYLWADRDSEPLHLWLEKRYSAKI